MHYWRGLGNPTRSTKEGGVIPRQGRGYRRWRHLPLAERALAVRQWGDFGLQIIAD